MAEELEVLQGSALEIVTTAELNNAVDVAKRYPRDNQLIKRNLLEYAGCDQETAESCFYVKVVDIKKNVKAEGNSIRMAEIIASVYGNIKFGSRILGIEEKFVNVQGVAMDLESNVSYTVDIKRSIWSDKGKYRYSQNLIQTTIKAAQAIAVRDAIFKVIPMAKYKAEINQIKKISTGQITADGEEVETLQQRVDKAISYFNKEYSVSFERIQKALEKLPEDEFTEEDLEILTGLKTGIKQKETTVEEAFPLPVGEAQEKKSDGAVESTGKLFKKDDSEEDSKEIKK